MHSRTQRQYESVLHPLCDCNIKPLLLQYVDFANESGMFVDRLISEPERRYNLYNVRTKGNSCRIINRCFKLTLNHRKTTLNKLVFITYVKRL